MTKLKKSTALRNRLLSTYNSVKLQMAVVSDISEELILKRIESGNYEVKIIVDASPKFFRCQDGGLHTFAVGLNPDGSIITY